MDRILDYLLEGERLITLIGVVGVPFIMAVGGGWLFYKLMKMHREERVEWREDFGKVLTRMEEIDAHGTTVIEGVTDALRGHTQMIAAFLDVKSPRRRRKTTQRR